MPKRLKFFRTFYVAGFVLLFVALLSFIFDTRFLDIPPIVFEGVGFSAIAFAAGSSKAKALLGLFLVFFLVAAIVDPLVWSARELNLKHAGLLSIAINGIMGLITAISYCAGSVMRKKITG